MTRDVCEVDSARERERGREPGEGEREGDGVAARWSVKKYCQE